MDASGEKNKDPAMKFIIMQFNINISYKDIYF